MERRPVERVDDDHEEDAYGSSSEQQTNLLRHAKRPRSAARTKAARVTCERRNRNEVDDYAEPRDDDEHRNAGDLHNSERLRYFIFIFK